MKTNQLTDRELEVVFWTANGKEPADTAQILEISAKRVNNVLYELRKRFSCNTTAHLIALCMARGYITSCQIYDGERRLGSRSWHKAVAQFLTVVMLVGASDLEQADDMQRLFRTRLRRREEVELTL